MRAPDEHRAPLSRSGRQFDALLSLPLVCLGPHLLDDLVRMPSDFSEAGAAVSIVDPKVRSIALRQVDDMARVTDVGRDHCDGHLFDLACRVATERISEKVTAQCFGPR